MTHEEFQQTSLDVNDCFSLVIIRTMSHFPSLFLQMVKYFYFIFSSSCYYNSEWLHTWVSEVRVLKWSSLSVFAGEESLRSCFQYFEEIDYDHHKRFFRHLGISDNVIKSKEHHLYEDRIHELLNIWVEKMGREATLNDLLKALLDLNQRRTAETIKDNAILNGHYFVVRQPLWKHVVLRVPLEF